MLIPQASLQVTRTFFMTFKPFRHQPRKMVKSTQTIHRQQPTSVFDCFVGLAFKGLIPFQVQLSQMFSRLVYSTRLIGDLNLVPQFLMQNQ